jgi:hypothetical protein
MIHVRDAFFADLTIETDDEVFEVRFWREADARQWPVLAQILQATPSQGG